MIQNSNGKEFEDFIGYIEQILEIDFILMKRILILCKWFEAFQRRPYTSVKTNNYGFTLFNSISKKISCTKKYGNPCAEPQKIR
jgi:hypothetical protein